MTKVPTVDEVLRDAPKNWGKWGEENEVGALDYLTTEEVFRGVRHIKSGTVFTLQRLIGDPKGDPVWPGRTSAEKTMILDESSWDGDGAPQFPGGLHYADDKISAFLQGSTQYDALFDQGEEFYEGFCEPGLVYSPELVQWFQDMEIPNLVTDTIANEVTTDPNSGVQVPAFDRVRRGPAEDRDREDPAARVA